MKSIKTSILAIVSYVMLFTSCNYLDVSDYFEDLVNLNSVFQSKVYLEKYLWGQPRCCCGRGQHIRVQLIPSYTGIG